MYPCFLLSTFLRSTRMNAEGNAEFHSGHLSGTIGCMSNTEDTIAFIKEREEKLGAPLRFRTYSTWFGRVGGETRQYGVFLYSDGKTMVYEDFERNPSILGFQIPVKRKEKYVKLERSFPVSDIADISRVTMRSAEKSLAQERDLAFPAGKVTAILRRTVTKVRLSDGSVIFLELMDHKAFIRTIQQFQKEEGDGRIQGV